MRFPRAGISAAVAGVRGRRGHRISYTICCTKFYTAVVRHLVLPIRPVRRGKLYGTQPLDRSCRRSEIGSMSCRVWFSRDETSNLDWLMRSLTSELAGSSQQKNDEKSFGAGTMGLQQGSRDSTMLSAARLHAAPPDSLTLVRMNVGTPGPSANGPRDQTPREHFGFDACLGSEKARPTPRAAD